VAAAVVRFRLSRAGRGVACFGMIDLTLFRLSVT
jgi:hypothetical protein